MIIMIADWAAYSYDATIHTLLHKNGIAIPRSMVVLRAIIEIELI